MRRNLPMIVRGVLALSLAATIAGPARADLADGLLAHWKLDETGGDAIADSAGNHTGINHGAELGQPGVLATAAALNPAEDDFVDLGESLQLDAGNQVTVSAFVYPESFSPPDSQNRANSRNGILGDSHTRFIFALTDGGRPVFVWDPGDREFQTIDADPGDAVPPGVWSHVAVTRNGATMMLYVDGVVKKIGGEFSSAPFAKLGRMHLGRVNGSPGRDFHGRLDDVRVYDRALSATEIRALACAAKLPKRPFGEGQLDRLAYNSPGLAVDLGVGLWAWPLPMDYDGDGDLDLLVSCHDVPYNGTYFFENPGGDPKFPVFKPGVPIGGGLGNVQVSHLGKGDRHLLPERPGGCFAQKVPVTFSPRKPRVLVPGWEYVDVPTNGLGMRVKLPVSTQVHEPGRKIRANQWKYADYDGDGAVDLVVGVGDWTDYGWDNAFNEQGQWTNGPLHGYVYLLRNQGTTDEPDYEKPVKIEAGAGPIDVYGMPSPCLEDFDGDGDLDVICGEFVDKLTWFENVGTRTEPKYAAGRYLVDRDDTPTRSASEAKPPLTMPLCMITPTAVDWDRDGDCDLVVGQEDGRVALVENTGELADRMPVFKAPRFFQQEAHEVKFGALATPVGFDWDGDGDDDLVSGNTAGEVGFLENLGGCPPQWAAPVLLEADGTPIRIEAGPNGSIQGPCETKWGYTTISVADWDHDGLPDVVANTIWGKVHWYRNVGTRREPKLAAAEPIRVEWPGTPPKPEWNWWNPEGKELATQWRTTPCVVDLTGDGLVDLVMLDHEGYLALYERKKVDGKLVLLPPERAFWSEGPSVFNSGHGVGEKGPGLLRLNDGVAGRSGRRKLSFVDWDLDGRVDLLVNSRSIDWLRNEGTRDGNILLKPMGPLASRRLAGHTTSPTTVDWDRNGIPDLLVGAEDGYFYYLKNPHASGSP
ncbi:MAG TPA: FG-GAP-like repeat-containing protein [Thermoguttaceae bacterium]|nr:FG-GAP-like repeat-containing protein [Thermoguttaceae bacterium]